MTRRLFLAALALAATAAPVTSQDAPAAKELYRIRIFNQAGGVVELSADGGSVWEPLGKVTRPATTVSASTDVITIAPPSSVAAVTPEHLIVRIPAGKSGNRTFRIMAKDEAPNASGVSTDIPNRGPLFRGIAPPVGSAVSVERAGKLVTLGAGYVPHAGDRFVIQVTAPPTTDATTITFENKVGGDVVLSSQNGVPKVLAKVKQPLKGIGRYAGTERAGSGTVLSWSPTAVLVSTAGTLRKEGPKSELPEERGGFVVQPAEPALRGTTHPASQLLIEAVAEGEAKPVVSPFFAIPAPLTTADPLDTKPTRVEVRIDGQEWEPCPDLRGTIDEEDLVKAVQAAVGDKRTVKEGITHLRFVYVPMGGGDLQRRLRLAVTPAAEAVQRGKVVISANVMGEGIKFVQFFLNGRLVQLTNQPPFNWHWDTTQISNGEHLLEIRGLDDRLATVTSALTKVIVDN